MSTLATLPNNNSYDTEAELLKDALKWLTAQRRSGIKPVRVCDRYTKGISDILICSQGHFICAELKDNTGKPSPHQINFLREMSESGATGGICRSTQDIADLIYEATYCQCHGITHDPKYTFCPLCGRRILR